MVTFDQSLDYPVEGETIEEIALEYDLNVDEIRDKIWIAGGEETYTSNIRAIGDVLEEHPDYVCIAPTGSPDRSSWSAWIGDSYGTLAEGGTKDEQYLDAVRVTFNRQAEKLGIRCDRDVVLLWTPPVRSLEHVGLSRNEARVYLRYDAGESVSDIADELDITPQEAQNLIGTVESRIEEARQTLGSLDVEELQTMIAMHPPMGTSGEEVADSFNKNIENLFDKYESMTKHPQEYPYHEYLLLTEGAESYTEIYDMASRSSES